MSRGAGDVRSERRRLSNDLESFFASWWERFAVDATCPPDITTALRVSGLTRVPTHSAGGCILETYAEQTSCD